jgi:hypothetical protein
MGFYVLSFISSMSPVILTSLVQQFGINVALIQKNRRNRGQNSFKPRGKHKTRTSVHINPQQIITPAVTVSEIIRPRGNLLRRKCMLISGIGSTRACVARSRLDTRARTTTNITASSRWRSWAVSFHRSVAPWFLLNPPVMSPPPELKPAATRPAGRAC